MTRTRTWTSLGLLAVELLGTVGCNEPVRTPEVLITNTMIRERGYDAMNRQDWVQARDHFARAAERRPDDALAWFYLGRMHMELNQPLDAELALEKAYALQPNNPQLTPRVLDLLAEAMFQQQRHDALASFLAETANNTNRSADYLRQARYLIRIGDPDGAIVAYRKAAFFAPRGDARPYLELADYYLSINDVTNGTLALRYAYHENPEAPGLADLFRKLDIIPGPTVGLQPPKPEFPLE